MLRLTISKKLPIILILLTTLSVVMVTSIAGYLMRRETMRNALNNLTDYQTAKKIELANYLDSVDDDITVLASIDYTRQAIRDFDSAWSSFGEGQTETLQKLYIDENPNKAGEKEKYDMASDGSLYSATHAKYHPWMREFLKRKGYYDIFLFNEKGDVVYTVFKERDFATNVVDGKWKDSELGKVFRDVKNNAKAGNIVFSDFAKYAPSNGAPAGFISSPVLDENGVFIGAIAFQMPAGAIDEMLAQAKELGDTADGYLVGADKLFRTNYRFSKEPTMLNEEVNEPGVILALEGKTGSMIAIDDQTKENGITVYTPIDYHGVRWAMVTEISEKEVLNDFYDIIKTAIAASIGILMLIAVIGIFYARSLTNPIKKMVQTMKVLAEGDNSVVIPSLERHDELGDMAKAVQVFKENAMEMERLEAETERNKIRAEEEKKVAMHKMADDFDGRTSSIILSLSSASQQMQETASKMNSASERTAEISSAVAAAATEADANVQTVAAATEELTASSREIAQQINMVATMATNAAHEAEHTSTEVKNLQEMALSVGDVVVAIKAIADQTNLLALNATIEAARAGEAGKGFAVVADEVKKLANETASKTEEIHDRVTRIQNAITASVTAMDKIIRNVKSIDEATTSVTAAVEEQNAATGEIGRNVSEASTGTQQVSNNIITVQENAYETGEASKTVLQAASELSKLSADLRVQVSSFLGKSGEMPGRKIRRSNYWMFSRLQRNKIQ